MSNPPVVEVKEILNLKDVLFVGKNKKYTINKKINRIILMNEYRAFKELLHYSTKKTSLKGDIEVLIKIKTYFDIDAIVGVILDAIQGKVFKNDRDVCRLVVEKEKLPKGQRGEVQVFLKSFKKEYEK